MQQQLTTIYSYCTKIDGKLFIFMQGSAQVHTACETTFLPVTSPNVHKF